MQKRYVFEVQVPGDSGRVSAHSACSYQTEQEAMTIAQGLVRASWVHQVNPAGTRIVVRDTDGFFFAADLVFPPFKGSATVHCFRSE